MTEDYDNVCLGDLGLKQLYMLAPQALTEEHGARIEFPMGGAIVIISECEGFRTVEFNRCVIERFPTATIVRLQKDVREGIEERVCR